MKALSIKQLWAHSILHLGKDIENRDWSTNFRGTVAIHASKGITKQQYEESAYMIYEIANYQANLPSFHNVKLGAILGTVEIVDCVTHSDSDWFFGKYGFVLKNPRPLIQPIFCKGALGFWEVPKEIEEKIVKELG